MTLTALLWPTVATAMYATAYATRARHRQSPLLLAALMLGLVLLASSADAASYRASVRPFVWLLGPQVVALAVPLERERRRRSVPFAKAGAVLLASATVGIFVTIATLRILNGGALLERTLAPRASTSALAVPTATALGGSPSLAALAVALSGLAVAIVGPWLLTRLGARDALSRGLALGASGHLAATSRAHEEGANTGAAASFALVVHGVLTTAIVWLLRASSLL